MSDEKTEKTEKGWDRDGYVKARDKNVADYAAGDPRLDTRRTDDFAKDEFVPQQVDGPDATLESQARHAEWCAENAEDEGEKFRLGEVAKDARARAGDRPARDRADGAGAETASAGPGEQRDRSKPPAKVQASGKSTPDGKAGQS